MKLSRVSITGNATLLGTTLALLACSGGDGGPTAIEIPVAGIEVTEPCTVIIEAESCQIGVRATAADGRVIQNPILRYITTNASAADVNTNGLVFGRAAGSATIFVTNSTGSVNDQFRVNVLPRTTPK